MSTPDCTKCDVGCLHHDSTPCMPEYVSEPSHKCTDCPFSAEIDAGFACGEWDCTPEYARERASIERGYMQANASITELERHAQDYKLLISASDDKDEINSLCIKLHAIEHAQNVIESTCSDCGHQCDGICMVDYDAYLEQQKR